MRSELASRLRAAGIVLLVCAGCSGSGSGSGGTTPTDRGSRAAAPIEAASAAPAASAAGPGVQTSTAGAAASVGVASSAAGPNAAPLLASDSEPKGVAPLTDAERRELRGACQPLGHAVAQAAPRQSTPMQGVEAAEQVLAHPPELRGVDVPHCTNLLQRQLRRYRAGLIEDEAITGLKTIMVGMASAYQAEPRHLCPSAPGVPADLAPLETGSYASTSADWQADGWRCVHFDRSTAGPQRFQYELRVDRAAESFEIVARGFPVRGYGPEELFLRGKVQGNRLEPSSAVYRR